MCYTIHKLVRNLPANESGLKLRSLSDGEPGGILSLGFLTQSTQAAKLQK